MRMVSPTSRIVFLGILFVATVSNGVSEAFVTLQYNIASITPCRSLTLSGLAFHPQKAKDSDFHTPAESFTFTRHAKATISSEYVQSEWKVDDSSKRLSYLDVISSTASVSNSFDQKQDAIDLDTPDEPIAQAHRIQQAYREWCEVSNRIKIFHNSKFSKIITLTFSDLQNQMKVLWENPKKGTSWNLCFEFSCCSRLPRKNGSTVGS